MSSDTSDEENLDFLREAQDSQFINDSMFNKGTVRSAKTVGIAYKETLPSLWKNKDKEEEFNSYKVTPGFANYVAKQLSQILDKQLKYSVSKNLEIKNINKKKCSKGGIKLFKDSKYYLDTEANINLLDFQANSHKKITNRAKVNQYKNFQVRPSEDSLKEVVVSGEDILKKSEVKFWSQRSKAQVFEYKKLENGQFLLIESKLQ